MMLDVDSYTFLYCDLGAVLNANFNVVLNADLNIVLNVAFHAPICCFPVAQ